METMSADSPHAKIQMALANARSKGATQARLAVQSDNKTAVLTDNREPGKLRSQTFNLVEHHPLSADWDPHQHLRLHVVPAGLHTHLISSRTSGEFSKDHLTSVGENDVATRPTPDNRYMVHLTQERRLCRTTILSPDGTSRAVKSYHADITLHHTPDREPGTPVAPTRLSIIAEPLQTNVVGPTISDRILITETGLTLAAETLQTMAQQSRGHVWANRQLAQEIADLSATNPKVPTPPDPPSVSRYSTRLPDGTEKQNQALTPSHAVVLDHLISHNRSVARSMAKYAPRNLQQVTSQDPDIPVLTLLDVQITTQNGGKRVYNMARTKQPLQNRLAHSTVERVRAISLTMEITHPAGTGQEPDVFTFDTDVFADRDDRNHILLMTTESGLSTQELKAVADLHGPTTHNMTDGASEAYASDPDDWYKTHLIDTLIHGPERAAHTALESLAAVAEALGLGDDQSGALRDIKASSPDGRLSMSLNPGTSAGFHLPPPNPPFTLANPTDMDQDSAITVVTTENPGAIQPGHVLTYNKTNRKLETFQPEDTPILRRVHPLTVTPSPDPVNDPVWTSPNTRWTVMSRGDRHLILAPLPE